MATRTVRVSDLSDVDLSTDAPSVIITIAVAGEETEGRKMDITTEEYEDLRAILAPYFAVGEEFTGKPATTKIAPTKADAERLAAVRAWAKEVGPDYTWNGETLGTVSANGRLAAKAYRLYDAYQENAAKVDAEDAAKDQTANGDAPVSDPFTTAKPGPKAAAKATK